MKNIVPVVFLLLLLPALSHGHDAQKSTKKSTQKSAQKSTQKDVQRLVAAVKGQTPIIDDLRQLSDEIGGRITGSAANKKAVEWAVEKFRQAGVPVHKEAFELPQAWIERSASAMVSGDDIAFTAQIVAMPFTTLGKDSGKDGSISGELVDMHKGDSRAFAPWTNSASGQMPKLKDKWLLVETAVLDDHSGIHGLFQEYVDAVDIETRAMAAGAAGLVYMSSRPKNLLYRHLPSRGSDNKLPIIVMERENALKIQRLLGLGKKLSLTATLDILSGPAYTADNVIGEIKGSTQADEIVLIGAHIDSFDLGSGALDNGSNVTLVLDLARQMQKLAIKPRRTIRFALFNGEEQGIFGSWGYTKTHADELDKHVIISTIDIGTGRINGFFTNGRKEIGHALTSVLQPVADQGPFTLINQPVVGTDNYDFMIQGVANLVASQADANYASNYHAQSDTFDKVDQQQLKLNAAIMAAMTLGFANLEQIPWQRQSAAEVVEMVEKFDLESAMKTFGLYQSWKNNQRGIKHPKP